MERPVRLWVERLIPWFGGVGWGVSTGVVVDAAATVGREAVSVAVARLPLLWWGDYFYWV